MSSNQTKLITIIGIIVIVAAIGIGVTINSKPTSSKKTAVVTISPTPTTTASTTASADSTTSTSVYKDGTYTATGTYTSPGGKQSITIKVTLADDKITDTSATSGAVDGESSEYQNDFIGGYKSLIVGKSLSSVNLSKVSGSSLTSAGFNNAIATIKTQAKA